jgi:hypothetical protein
VAVLGGWRAGMSDWACLPALLAGWSRVPAGFCVCWPNLVRICTADKPPGRRRVEPLSHSAAKELYDQRLRRLVEVPVPGEVLDVQMTSGVPLLGREILDVRGEHVQLRRATPDV